jgi:hypothetical protein
VGGAVEGLVCVLPVSARLPCPPQSHRAGQRLGLEQQAGVVYVPGLLIVHYADGGAPVRVHGHQARAVRLRGAGEAGGDWQHAHQALHRAAHALDQAERSLANRDFHRELYAGCGNPLLAKMLDDLRDQTALVSATAWRHEPDHAQTPSWEHEAAEHRSMLRAAEDGDAERAAALLRDHITSFAARNFVKPQEDQKV